MTRNAYEDKIVSLLRQDPTKAYTEAQIRMAVTGYRTPFTLKDPFVINRAYDDVSDALQSLVQKSAVYKKEGGLAEAMYGIRMSLAEKTKLRISRSGAYHRIWCISASLDRRVKAIHRNWLALVGIGMGSFTAVMLAVRSLLP